MAEQSASQPGAGNPPVRWYDYITTNIYFLGLSTLSQTMTPLILPLLVQQFVGEEGKAGFYGSLRLWGLMVALLAQSLWGALSDRTTLRFGRRRPYIFGGTIAGVLLIAAIGSMLGMGGMSGYWLLFLLTILLQIATNAGQAAQQALIPDLVPEDRRGRFSAVKSLFEVPLPVLIISLTVGRIIGGGNMWGGILLMAAILAATMLITMLVRERPLYDAPPMDWMPFLRLVAMAGVFTAIILGMGAVVTWAASRLAGISSLPALLLILGAVGLAAMVVAIGLGVWLSVRIGLGEPAGRNPAFTWWIINRLAFLVGVVNLSAFVIYFLQARLGLAKERAAGPAANLMLVVGVSIMAFALLSGWLSDRFGHRRLVAASGLIAFLGTLVAIGTTNLTVVYAGGAIIGAATGLFYTSNWALGTSVVPGADAGRYLGISNLAGAGAGAVGAYIGGPIADHITTYVPGTPGLGYVVLLAIYGGLFLLSVCAVARVRES
jgi:MFS family permease